MEDEKHNTENEEKNEVPNAPDNDKDNVPENEVNPNAPDNENNNVTNSPDVPYDPDALNNPIDKPEDKENPDSVYVEYNTLPEIIDDLDSKVDKSHKHKEVSKSFIEHYNKYRMKNDPNNLHSKDYINFNTGNEAQRKNPKNKKRKTPQRQQPKIKKYKRQNLAAN